MKGSLIVDVKQNAYVFLLIKYFVLRVKHDPSFSTGWLHMACQNCKWRAMEIVRYSGFFPSKENLCDILLSPHYLALLLHVPSLCLIYVKILLNSSEL